MVSVGLDPVSHSRGKARQEPIQTPRLGYVTLVGRSCKSHLERDVGIEVCGSWGPLLQAVDPMCSPRKQDDMVSEHIFTPSLPGSYLCLAHLP